LLLITLALAIPALVHVALSWDAPLPDNWGFRGNFSLSALVFGIPGFVVAVRRAENPIGWLMLVGALSNALCGAAQEYATRALLISPGSLPAGAVVAWSASWIWLPSAGTALFLDPLLFPDGHLPSRRWWPALYGAVAFVAFGFVVFALRAGPLENFIGLENPFALPGLTPTHWAESPSAFLGVLLPSLVANAAAPFVRMRTARGALALQIKWFALSAAIVVTAFVVLVASDAAKPTQIAMVAAFYTMPLAMAIAIVRYRLYDIDILINRTVVYGATSAAIVVTFFVGIVGLQALLRPITSGNELAIAAATVLSFGLFQPVRRRVQGAVDRRFDRSRYDAARTLDAFADRLRDQVDLDTLRHDLLGAVRRTMSPAHSSIWLRGVDE
jgi:hypothetical protein